MYVWPCGYMWRQCGDIRTNSLYSVGISIHNFTWLQEAIAACGGAHGAAASAVAGPSSDSGRSVSLSCVRQSIALRPATTCLTGFPQSTSHLPRVRCRQPAMKLQIQRPDRVRMSGPRPAPLRRDIAAYAHGERAQPHERAQACSRTCTTKRVAELSCAIRRGAGLASGVEPDLRKDPTDEADAHEGIDRAANRDKPRHAGSRDLCAKRGDPSPMVGLAGEHHKRWHAAHDTLWAMACAWGWLMHMHGRHQFASECARARALAGWGRRGGRLGMRLRPNLGHLVEALNKALEDIVGPA